MNSTRATLILSLALALSAAGCGGNGAATSDAGHPAGPDAAALEPDAATPAGSDAATLEPDAAAPPPARTLVPMHLLGSTPLDNGMLDPDLNNLGMWTIYKNSDYSTPTHYRSALAATPANLPVLNIDEGGSTAGVLVGTFAFGGKGPFTASVWLGQPKKSPTPATLSSTLYALDASGTDASSTAFDLAADDTTTQDLGTIHWTQFTAKIDTGILGWAILTISDSSGSSLYVSAPVLSEDKTRMLVVPKPGRPLAVQEHQALKRVVDDLRRHMPWGKRGLKPKPWPLHH